MRLFLLLLTLFFTLPPLSAQPRFPKGFPARPAVSPTLLGNTQQLRQHREEQLKRESVLNTLAERQNPVNWKELSWQEFLQQNEHTKGVERVSFHLEIKCTEEFCQLLPAPIPLNTVSTFGNSEVDYEKILKNQKLIYVAEANAHGTQRAPLEMAKILRAARKINPGAKILFAAEFLEWRNNDNLPAWKPALSQQQEIDTTEASYYDNLTMLKENKDQLSPAQYEAYVTDIQKELQQITEYKREVSQLKQKIKQTPLLKKAGQESDLFTSPEYLPVFKAADEAGIDQLALDDWVWGMDENRLGVKVGEFIIWAGNKEKFPVWRNTTSDDQRYSMLTESVSVSPWGVRERNREWARRIKILQPIYDVIIVYAGNGHLSNTYYMDLQPMVEQKDFLDIILYPTEKLSTDMQEYYDQRDSLAEKSHITHDAATSIYREEISTLASQAIEENSLPWEDLSKPLWRYVSEEGEEKVRQTWTQEKRQAWKAASQQEERDFPFKYPKAVLQVYLPAE